MKNFLLSLTMAVLVTSSFAQKTEFYTTLNSGLFSFRGVSAVSSTQINAYRSDFSPLTTYTNNPYGNKNGLCAGVSVGVKRVFKSKLIVGTELGFELLRSRVDIDTVNQSNDLFNIVLPSSGKTNLNFSFLHAFPYIGYRIPAGSFILDVALGADIAYCATARESGSAITMDGYEYTTSENRKTINFDLRPRMQISMWYKRIGIYAGYSLGIINYKSGYIGGTNEAWSRMIRFGIGYQLK